MKQYNYPLGVAKNLQGYLREILNDSCATQTKANTT